MTALSPMLAIQTAIYNLFTSDSTLMAMITGVFDTVNQKQAFPYVTIADLQNNDWGSMSFTGVDGKITINVWSQVPSSIEAKQIMARIYSLLHETKPAVTGFSVCMLRFDFEHLMLDQDGLTHHGIQRFRYLVGS